MLLVAQCGEHLTPTMLIDGTRSNLLQDNEHLRGQRRIQLER